MQDITARGIICIYDTGLTDSILIEKATGYEAGIVILKYIQLSIH